MIVDTVPEVLLFRMYPITHGGAEGASYPVPPARISSLIGIGPHQSETGYVLGKEAAVINVIRSNSPAR